MKHQSSRNPDIREQDLSLCLQIVNKTSLPHKAQVDQEVAEFFREIRAAYNKPSYRIEELVTPMVYKSLTSVVAGNRMGMIRQVIEKACSILVQTMLSNTVTS